MTVGKCLSFENDQSRKDTTFRCSLKKETANVRSFVNRSISSLNKSMKIDGISSRKDEKRSEDDSITTKDVQ